MKEITVELRKWIILVYIYIYIYKTALQETRRNENGWIDKEEYTLFYGAEREQRQGNGTAFVVIKNELKKSVSGPRTIEGSSGRS
jgi:hypothetical protein